MAEEKILKHVYHGPQKLTIQSGSTCNFVVHRPKDIEILAATASGIEDKQLQLNIKGVSVNIAPRYKEENIEITFPMQFPRNKKFTIQIPKSGNQPVISFSPLDNLSAKPLEFPLQSFMTGTSDPLKIFMFNLSQSTSGSVPVLNLSGDTSYLKELNFNPVLDDNADMLFTQALKDKLTIADGAVHIDSLSDEQCDQIINEVLGENYDDQLDMEKVEKGEGKSFWTAKKAVSTAAKTAYKVYLSRHILQDFGTNGKFYVKTVNGSQYVIFKGAKGHRKWYSGNRYKITNPKVLSLSASGKLKTAFKGMSVTLLIVGTIDIVDWMMKEENEREFSELCVTLGMDVLKTVVNSIITAGVVAFVLFWLATSVVTLPVCVVVVGSIVVGVMVGFGIDFIDQKIGVSDYMKGKGREAETFLKEAWKENVVEPMCRLLYQLEKSIENQYYIPFRN